MTAPCRLCTAGEIVGRASTVVTMDGREADENVPCPVCAPRGADMARDVQLSGLADVSVPSLRRVARWFSIPVSNAAGMNAATLKGQFTWAGNALAFEQAKLHELFACDAFFDHEY